MAEWVDALPNNLVTLPYVIMLHMASYKYTKEYLEPLVLQHKSIRQILITLGLREAGGNYSHISKLIKEYGISTSHFHGQGWAKNKKAKNRHTKQSFIDKVLQLNGLKWSSHHIKLKLYEFGLKEPICEVCNTENWNSKELKFELHHINGNINDNRLENLLIVCPNCHSQFPNTHKRK